MNDAAKPSEKGLHKYQYRIGVRDGPGYFGHHAAAVIAAANAEDALFLIKQRWPPNSRYGNGIVYFWAQYAPLEAVGDDTPVSDLANVHLLFDADTQAQIRNCR
jgi:hypothetical protein